MFPFSLVVVGLAVAGLFLVVRAAFSAPEAVEDEHGFHLSSKEETAHVQPPIPVSAADLAFFRH